MKIADIIAVLEGWAPLALQENYDNAGLLTGDPGWTCSGILCTLDATEAVIDEAIGKKLNLVVAHHPIIFGGLKKLNGKNYVERTVIKAIKHDIAIYAIHTNLDNVIDGVNGKVAGMLGLQKTSILQPKPGTLRKLICFVPSGHLDVVRNDLFSAGAGVISQYSECSFSAPGTGTFLAGPGTDPFVGEQGRRHEENEVKLELIYPAYLERNVLNAMRKNHPYEEVAYDILPVTNAHPGIGSGIIGEWSEALDETAALDLFRKLFGLGIVRHTPLTGRKVKKVAFCGGAGSFLISSALGAGADLYVTADLKYHEFFDADGRLLLADIGHFESEQFTINLLQEVLAQKFPTFAVLKTAIKTNPVQYFTGL